MKYIVIPPEVGPVPPITFDFAIEEFAARHFTDDDYCFIWQTRPTVIIGRNQLLVNEVNVDYCNANDVFIARRKSGGGAMYSDKGNVMFSFISSEPDLILLNGCGETYEVRLPAPDPEMEYIEYIPYSTDSSLLPSPTK